MKKTLFTLICCLLTGSFFAQDLPQEGLYGTGKWDADSLGNHRVVLRVTQKSDAVQATIPWRRKDRQPENKNIIVVDAATGKQLTNLRPFSITRETGKIAFQPVTVPGTYYVYYLQNKMSGSRYYPTVNYPAYEDKAAPEWLKKNKLTGKTAPTLPRAEVLQYQSIDDFNTFYPMEVIATAAETENLLKAHPADNYLLFTEDRAFPIRMTTDLPYKWIADNRHDFFNGTAAKGEYYAFQVGVWAARTPVEALNITFADLTNARTGAVLPAASFTCFNTEGVDVTGSTFKKNCSVEKGKIQPLWIGLQVPEQAVAGSYQGTVTVSGKGIPAKQIRLTLQVTNDVIAAHGDNEPWRHSRLRWLNSQVGFDDEVIAPYTPLEQNGNTIACLGRTVELSPLGLPKQITSYFTEAMTGIGAAGKPMLSAPIQLLVDGGGNWQPLNFEYTKHKHGAIAWKTISSNNAFIMECQAQMEADGNIEYKLTLVAQQDAAVNDIRLETRLNTGIAKYMMGLGQKGGYCPDNLAWKWDVQKNQDGPWVGTVNAGMQLRFYDQNYDRPLNTNFYHQKPLQMPPSWYNNGKGGIKLEQETNGTLINAYSGNRELKKGDVLHYYFNVAVTPFRPLDVKKQWRDRYYHEYKFIDDIETYGGSVINIHHANAINPYINYPFLRVNEMKAYIDGAHAKDKKVKIYNTVRELSNHAPELFALRSLGNEIFSEGKGNGFSWLQEHLDQNYIGAWFVPQLKDAAIVNSGVSRWHNYYLEGLNWLVKNVGIDGLYIDDLAFDRMTMKRVRKILNAGNPGALIDLHSANQYNDKDGFANSANLYMEHFPYIDRLWFGEYFDYNLPPDFWLIEVSGIPYGLMGEMLWEGGNQWRGMLYGITPRAPGTGDPRPLWKLWDNFGIDQSQMIGYWVSDNPVKTGSEKTLATAYVREGQKTLISLATWEDADASVTLSIDWKRLGLNPATVRLHAPAIENFQPEATYKPGDTITVPKGKGVMLIVE